IEAAAEERSTEPEASEPVINTVVAEPLVAPSAEQIDEPPVSDAGPDEPFDAPSEAFAIPSPPPVDAAGSIVPPVFTPEPFNSAPLPDIAEALEPAASDVSAPDVVADLPLPEPSVASLS